MITVKHIERLWTGRMYDRLLRELLANRPEAGLRLELELAGTCRATPAAALAMIRLNELNQSHQPLQTKLVRTLVATQEVDGGWGDPVATTLASRALLNDNGDGAVIDRGLHYLAMLQKPEGIWPNVPFRRMPADPYVSAFILYQLGRHPRFRSAVRFLDALNWFESHESSLDPETRRLWDRASLRCRIDLTPGASPATSRSARAARWEPGLWSLACGG
jgi:hypothetical protein